MEFRNNPEKRTITNYNNLNLQARKQVVRESDPDRINEPVVTESDKKTATRLLDFLISLSFGALFFGLPLFFLNNTFQGIIFEKQIYFYFWVLIAVISWATKSVIIGELKIKETPLDYFIGAFLVVYFLSTIFSVDRWHSFFGLFGDPSRGFVNVLACVLVYYFILSNFTKKRLDIALTGIIASAIIVQLWTFTGLFFAVKLPLWLTSNVPANLFGSITSLGVFLSVVYPIFIIAIYKILESKLSKKVKITLAGLVGFFFVFDIVLMWFLYSFIFIVGVFPGLVVGVSFFVIFVIALIVRPLQGWSWITFFSFMAVMLILMIGGGDSYLPQSLPSEVSPAYGLSWNVAKGTLKDKFFLGTGVASYGYDFSKYKSQELNNTQFFNLRFYQGSGLFFEALPTIGFLGTVISILILLSYLGTSVYLLCREKEKNKMYSLGFFSAGIIFLYSVLTGRADGSVLIFGLLIVILSVAILQFESANEGQYKILSLKASPKYALALAFIFMLASGGVVYTFVFMGKALVADVYMKKATAINVTHSENDSVGKMVKAINLYSNEARYYARAGQEYLMLANDEALKGKDQQSAETIQKFLNNAIVLSNKAKELSPSDVLIVEELAQVYENSTMFVEKSADLAQQYYQQALELEPHNPVYYIKLGQLKIAKASATQDDVEKKQLIDESIGLFQKSVNEKKDYAVGYYYIAIANQSAGNLDKAIDSIKSAIINERSNADYIFMLANFYSQRGNGDDYAQAEKLYKNIIEQDDKQYNVHLGLGVLYEKQKKNEAAIVEYRKVLTLLPDGSDDAKTQVNKMITNVQNGTGNLQALTKTATTSAAPTTQQSNSQPLPTQSTPQVENQTSPTAPLSPASIAPQSQPTTTGPGANNTVRP